MLTLKVLKNFGYYFPLPWLGRIELCSNMLSFSQIQGAIIVAPVLQVAVGLLGLVGFILKKIGPVTVAPAVALVGIGVLNPAAVRAGQHWGIAIL